MIMFCNFNLFDINAQVVAVEDNGTVKPLFSSNFEDVCEFMADEYQNNNYERIILAGPYAEAVESRVRAYSIANYNFEDINIEIME